MTGEDLGFIAFLYVGGVLTALLLAVIQWHDANAWCHWRKERREAQRRARLAFIWPLALLWVGSRMLFTVLFAKVPE